VNDADRLPSSYRRLLRAYPRWYRRERGVEILTTLLDATVPGQRRPARQDAVDIVGSGLRCRLRPPTGVGYRLTVAVMALFASLVGLAVAGLLSRPGAPTQAQAVAAASVATSVRPAMVAGPTAVCAWCPTWDDGPLQRHDFVAVGYRTPPQDVPARLAQAHARLAAAGWRVGPLTEDTDAGTVRVKADKDGIAISLTGVLATVFLDKDMSRPDPTFVPVTLVVTRGVTALAAVALTAGFLGGLLTGWLLTAWGLQCFRRHRRAVRATMLATGLPVLVLAGTMDTIAAQWAIGLTVFGHWSSGYLRAPAIGLAAVPALLAVVAVLAFATATVAAIPPRGRPPVRASPGADPDPAW
jgi:hypothetical protein